jgi:hypothetical protein
MGLDVTAVQWDGNKGYGRKAEDEIDAEDVTDLFFYALGFLVQRRFRDGSG